MVNEGASPSQPLTLLFSSPVSSFCCCCCCSVILIEGRVEGVSVCIVRFKGFLLV